MKYQRFYNLKKKTPITAKYIFISYPPFIILFEVMFTRNLGTFFYWPGSLLFWFYLSIYLFIHLYFSVKISKSTGYKEKTFGKIFKCLKSFVVMGVFKWQICLLEVVIVIIDVNNWYYYSLLSIYCCTWVFVFYLHIIFADFSLFSSDFFYM